MLTKQICGDTAADIIAALLRSGILTDKEASRAFSGEAVLLAIGEGEAVRRTLSAAVGPVGRPRSVSDEELGAARTMIEGDGMSLREAAKAIGKPPSTLSDNLALHEGRGRPRKLVGERLDEARRLMAAPGASLAAVAAAFAVSASTLKRALATSG